MKRGEEEKAMVDFHKSLDIKPHDVWPLRHLAWIYACGPERLRDPNQALPLARKAVELAPQREVCLTTLGATYYRLKRYDEALATLQQASVADEQIREHCVRLFFLAMTHHQLGDRPSPSARWHFDEAVEHLRRLNRPHSYRADELVTLRAEAERLLNN